MNDLPTIRRCVVSDDHGQTVPAVALGDSMLAINFGKGWGIWQAKDFTELPPESIAANPELARWCGPDEVERAATILAAHNACDQRDAAQQTIAAQSAEIATCQSHLKVAMQLGVEMKAENERQAAEIERLKREAAQDEAEIDGLISQLYAAQKTAIDPVQHRLIRAELSQHSAWLASKDTLHAELDAAGVPACEGESCRIAARVRWMRSRLDRAEALLREASIATWNIHCEWQTRSLNS